MYYNTCTLSEFSTLNSEICLFNALVYKEIIHVYKHINILIMGLERVIWFNAMTPDVLLQGHPRKHIQ